MKKIIESLRREYSREGLRAVSLPDHPIILLEQWIEEAIKKDITDPNAMILSTVSIEQKPSSRTVLMKGVDKKAIIFFTNYQSRKALEIKKNSNVSALFLWTVLERQIRIEGQIKLLDKKSSDEYFATRPRESQIAAWASPQSQEITDRKELEDRFKKYAIRFQDKTVPRPEHWGGYKIIPNYFEFWQGRAGRLNDRVSYKRENGKWKQVWLAP